MTAQFTKHHVRIECSDGRVRDGWQILFADGRVVLRTESGADPNSYEPARGAKRDVKAIEEVEKAREEAREIRKLFRTKYGVDQK